MQYSHSNHGPTGESAGKYSAGEVLKGTLSRKIVEASFEQQHTRIASWRNKGLFAANNVVEDRNHHTCCSSMQLPPIPCGQARAAGSARMIPTFALRNRYSTSRACLHDQYLPQARRFGKLTRRQKPLPHCCAVTAQQHAGSRAGCDQRPQSCVGQLFSKLSTGLAALVFCVGVAFCSPVATWAEGDDTALTIRFKASKEPELRAAQEDLASAWGALSIGGGCCLLDASELVCLVLHETPCPDRCLRL